jgi:hypothetical protein
MTHESLEVEAPKSGKVAIFVVAQLLGTSLWFSANAAFDDLARLWGIDTCCLRPGRFLRTWGKPLEAVAPPLSSSPAR